LWKAGITSIVESGVEQIVFFLKDSSLSSSQHLALRRRWEAAVGVLMLKCSITGREFFTDIQIDEVSFRELPDVVTKARCPHCGLMHSWWTREARLVGSYPPIDRAS
jgi:hypothetical protein